MSRLVHPTEKMIEPKVSRIHPSRKSKADEHRASVMMERRLGSYARRSSSSAEGRCLFSISLRFDEGGWVGNHFSNASRMKEKYGIMFLKINFIRYIAYFYKR